MICNEKDRAGQRRELGRDSGRRIDYATDIVSARKADAAIDRRERNLELQDDRIDVSQVRRRRVDIGRREPVVRALDHDDTILPVGPDEDGRYAGRCVIDELHVRRVDAERGEVVQRRPPEQIAAHLGHHQNLRAAESRRDRLVRTLAAEAHLKVLAEQGLAGSREDIRERRQVGVGAADDGDAGEGDMSVSPLAMQAQATAAINSLNKPDAPIRTPNQSCADHPWSNSNAGRTSTTC